MLFHSLRFLEAELQDAKERSLSSYEQEGKLAVEQLREAEEENWSSEGGACDQVADCSVYTNIHHY